LITINNNIPKALNRISEDIENKKWSQEELALKCELHRTYICNVECGERNITVLDSVAIQNKLEMKCWISFLKECRKRLYCFCKSFILNFQEKGLIF